MPSSKARRLQWSTRMSASSPPVSQAIQPAPIIPLPMVASEPAKPTEHDDDSIAPVTGPDGFASDARDAVGHSAVPWERRPLSPRGILAWTLGAMVGAVLLGTTMAVAFGRPASKENSQGALHGGEATDVPTVIQAPSGAAPSIAPPSGEPRVQAAPVIALEDLPKTADDPPRRRVIPSAPLHHVSSRAPRIDRVTSSGAVAPPADTPRRAPSRR